MEKFPKVIAVRWIDHASKEGWVDPMAGELCTCLSVGWLVNETEDKLCISTTLTDDGQVDYILSIFKAGITWRKTLSPPQRKKSKKGSGEK